MRQATAASGRPSCFCLYKHGAGLRRIVLAGEHQFDAEQRRTIRRRQLHTLTQCLRLLAAEQPGLWMQPELDAQPSSLLEQA